MAVDVRAHAQLNANTASPLSAAEEEALNIQLLRMRDSVLAGQHPQFKLPQAVIEQLKLLDAPAAPVVNGSAFHANRTTNHAQPSPAFGLPGLHTASPAHVNGVAHHVAAAAKPPSASCLDPIFLEKSDSLVRAEGALKRQRIERDLQAQVEQRKQSSQSRDHGADAPSSLNIAAILANAFARESHISGLRPATKAGGAASSSFDENDYYSSQVESDWSSPASASKASDRAAGAYSAAVGRNEEPSAQSAFSVNPVVSGKQPVTAHDTLPQGSKDHARVYSDQNHKLFEVDDEDDEYIPPDAAGFDSLAHAVPLDDDNDDDNSEYEPGEITQDGVAPTPYFQSQQPAHSSPHVPIIRNHLTHIAAPQPNRVSPLAVAKGPSIELELVNGRPEIVQKSRPVQNAAPSRVSTASPSANGAGASGKKRRQKKRKRDSEPSAKTKKKRDRHNNARSPPSPADLEPRIKDEPVSPPPFASASDMPQFARPPTYRPTEIELISPRHAPQAQYMEPPRSGLRYEYAQPASPAIVQIASPTSYRPVQRDSQDLRRVASLQYAQRPPSPTHRASSPAYRTVSMTYGDPRLAHTHVAPVEAEQARYQEQPAVQYVRADRSRSPPRLQEYHDAGPNMMPPPSAPPRRIVVDQYGNRYYAADPAPAPSRASVAPVDRRPLAELGYERAPSRMASLYAPAPASQYERPAEVRMAPPPPPLRRQVSDEHVQYVDSHGYPVRDREYSTRPMEQSQQVRYVDAPTSPVYQAAPRYEQMPPPPPPAREPTSPVYVPRSYSVRPEEPLQAAASYARQASVVPAPVQYVRQETVPVPARAFSQAPQLRYMDRYGNEVYPSEVRQAPGPEYRYQ